MSEPVAYSITRIVSDQAGVREDAIKPESRLVSDIGLDSLDLIEIVMFMEEYFEIDINEAEVERCATVADFIALVERRKGGAA